MNLNAQMTHPNWLISLSIWNNNSDEERFFPLRLVCAVIILKYLKWANVLFGGIAGLVVVVLVAYLVGRQAMDCISRKLKEGPLYG